MQSILTGFIFVCFLSLLVGYSVPPEIRIIGAVVTFSIVVVGCTLCWIFKEKLSNLRKEKKLNESRFVKYYYSDKNGVLRGFITALIIVAILGGIQVVVGENININTIIQMLILGAVFFLGTIMAFGKIDR